MRKMMRPVAGLAVFLMAAGAFCQGIPEYLNVGSITITSYDKDKLPENLVIPEGITGIGGGMFEECEQLKSVTIPGSMETIGEDTSRGELGIGSEWSEFVSHFVFYKCQSLKDLKIEDGVKVIGAGAFADCWSLESVSIPASVTKICGYAFARCKNIRTVRFGGTKEQWKKLGTYRFENTAVQCKDGTVPAVTKNLLVPGYLIVKDTVITGVEKEEWSFGNPSRANLLVITPPSELVIPDGITEIGDEAFTERFEDNIISVTIPRSVEKVGTSAFSRLHSLENVMILGTAEIGARAFEFCKNLKSVAFESGVTKIGDSAFTGCKSLESVTVPANVKEIGRWAFSDCPSLSVQYDGTKEQWDAIKKSEYGIGKFSVRFKDGSVAETGDDTALKIGHKGPGGGIIFDVTDTLIYEMCELEGKVSWSDAWQMCKEYRGGGYDNWYLPSPEQMQKVYTNLVTTRKIPLNGWYWGFTWHYRLGDMPYAMRLNDGEKDDNFSASDWGGNRKFSVMAVRAF